MAGNDQNLSLRMHGGFLGSGHFFGELQVSVGQWETSGCLSYHLFFSKAQLGPPALRLPIMIATPLGVITKSWNLRVLTVFRSAEW